MGHHHSLLLLPVAGVGLLLLLPLPVALPAWLGLFAFSGVAFARGVQAIAAPVTTGREGMLGDWVRVLGPVSGGWQVRHQGEVWSAVSPDSLARGQRARIVGFEGLKLVVVSDDPGAPAAQRTVADARRSTAAALARLEARMRSLEAGAEAREQSARRALDHDEDAARRYLLQRQALLAARDRLARQAAALRAAVARLEALERATRRH